MRNCVEFYALLSILALEYAGWHARADIYFSDDRRRTIACILRVNTTIYVSEQAVQRIMAKHLVIVESPAKGRTINKYLGKDFEVMASYGHIRDLVPKEGAVDTDDFSMKYELIDKNKKHVDALCRAAKKAEALYLATDPDREGEAIAWHVFETLREKKLLDAKPVHRVVFHEITQRAIRDAIDHPRTLSSDLVNAQQARRALDYLVGFNLSPLLWRKVRRGLSAGRVQSPALRMIVEREREIDAFTPREYWTIAADSVKNNQEFSAKLTRFDHEKISQFSIETGERAQEVKTALEQAARGELTVTSVEKKTRKRNPAAPFTTSTLQQEASRKLGFTAQRTMRTAQQLYEGVEIGAESVGLITYMRTDSVSLAQEAISDIRAFITERFGPDAAPAQPHLYKTKAKNAQEAHEAVRPTSIRRTPDELKSSLTPEQFKLYDIIWKRTLACQMIHATLHLTGVDFACGEGNTLRATGTVIADPGFMAVYRESKDDVKDDDKEQALPPLSEGERVPLRAIRADQSFTTPPPRFTEASLVKTLEEYGIGRPSTYASIISTLVAREYVDLEKRRFRPTDVGRVVNKFLTEHFDQYVDYEFTARLEDDLDAVSRGERAWKPLMRDFWQPFNARVDEKKAIPRSEVAPVRELGVDPKSGRPITARLGRFGPMVQIGTKDDEEKPVFAGLRADQNLDSITLEEALELFKLPRALGATPEGEEVSANIGRYGPYVRYGSSFVSMAKDDDPYTITLERALELVAAKKTADANKVIQSFEDGAVQILRGRYGPYITDGAKNARMPKGVNPEELTLAECRELLAKAPEKKARAKRGKAKKSS